MPRVARRVGRVYREIRDDSVLATIVAALVLASGFGVAHELSRFFKGHPQPSAAFLMGPADRTVYRCEHPDACQGSPRIVFNSTIDTPNYGDERYFVDVKRADDPRRRFTDALKVTQDGEVILLRAYVSNNADNNLVSTGRDIATNTMLRFEIPTGVAEELAPFAVLSATNADPPRVWDGTIVYADWPFRLKYVFRSARIENRDPLTCFGPNADVVVQTKPAKWRTLELSDSIVADGVAIGYPDLDGRYPGPFCAGALVTLRLRVAKWR
jgi:hypothetical protein